MGGAGQQAAVGPVGAAIGRAEIRPARTSDAAALHALISANVEPARLLPRSLDDLRLHAGRFLVVANGDAVLACGELAPLSRTLAEVRSLVVSDGHRGAGLGSRLLEAIAEKGRAAGFPMLCAFAHDPRPFVRLGFSIVPHVWLPEKISTDCHSCVWFRRCQQYAVVLDLARMADVGSRRRPDAIERHDDGPRRVIAVTSVPA